MSLRMLVLCAVTAGAASLAPSAAALSPPAVDVAGIDAVVQQYRDAANVPGVAVVVTRGAEVVHAAGYGHSPAGDPITEHTPMAVASVSKSFTALAVLQLVEAGRVDLGRPVRAYLPEFTLADPRVEAITVRQLLDQTSGMSDTTFAAFRRTQPGSLQEAVAGMRTAGLAAEPGTRYSYHNPNFQVAARLVEVVSGQPFDDYLRQHVFGPLGMSDSRTGNTERDLPPSAHGHIKILGGPIAAPEPRAFGNGSGGVLSSAADMGAWLIAQNNSGRGPNGAVIASAASIERSHTPSGVAGSSYALGWDVDTTASGAPLIAHSGDLFTATAYQALLPASGYGLAVIANTGLAWGDAAALAERLIALLEGAPVPAPPGALSSLGADAVLLLLTVGTVLLVVRGVLRSGRWATRRARRPLGVVARLLPLLLPLALCVSIHRVVGALYRGRDVAWIQVPYLYPTFMLLLAIATVGGGAVLLARLVGLARTRGAQEAVDRTAVDRTAVAGR
ncbi:serine hydrolase domain-containing protein [Goodfellowiella coeruleoviolacea]|uniref:serine hydrolase domain-containing protein n=1 Tax=Goodfellowiella coeruleoviolacea TaxID=334858 RepID=UPI0020A5456B|nr:serine hydrolase domain-containing protein [Goodfellowiella coeruleoviolacea]